MASIFDSAPAAGWPFYRHVIFDCDSTLSAIEGIDLLANSQDTRKQVVDLTRAAMSGVTPLDQVYGKRLELICPDRKSVQQLAVDYLAHVVAGARETVRALIDTGCEVYIVSGGLLEPVREFGIALGVPAAQICAVEIEYNQLQGQWWVSDTSDTEQQYLAYRHDELAESHGKASIIADLLKDQSGASLLIGDGVSDLLARNAVDLFVGYTGVESRARICDQAPVYFDAPSLLPLLPLALGSRYFFKLDSRLRQQCLDCIASHPLSFNRKVLERNFIASFCPPA